MCNMMNFQYFLFNFLNYNAWEQLMKTINVNQCVNVVQSVVLDVSAIFHMTRKIVSEMTYNVSMGTLNPTIPYHTVSAYYLQLLATCLVCMQ